MKTTYSRPRLTSIVLIGGIGLLAACDRREGARKSAADSTRTTSPASADVQLKLPEGFTATVFADSLGGARHLVASPNGNIYVNTWRSPYDTGRKTPPGGFVVGLRDTDGDGKADLVKRFGTTSESGSHGGTGIALRDGALYVEADSTIMGLGDQLLSVKEPEAGVTGAPSLPGTGDAGRVTTSAGGYGG